MAARERRDFIEILLRQGVLTPEQAEEARGIALKAGMKLSDVLVQSHFASSEQVARAVAQQYGLDYVNLYEVEIPKAILSIVPESVARENMVLPLAEEDGQLTVIVSDPEQFDLFDKLRFILNRRIGIALRPATYLWRPLLAITAVTERPI